MADRCPQCGAELPAPAPESCPACLKVLEAANTGITAAPAPASAGSFAEGTPPEAPRPRFEEETPSIVKAEATRPSCPPLLLVGLSPLLCALLGAATTSGGAVGFNFKSTESVVGAVVGFVIGLALAVDQWFFQQKLNQPAQIPGEEDGEPAGPAPPPSEWVSMAMLLMPIAAGVLIWFASPLRLTQTDVALIGPGAVLATAVLGYFSIRQMALRENRAASHYHGGLSSPAYMYLAMLFFWVIIYPVHFVLRWRMGGRNLIVPGLIATAAYCAPMVQPFLVDPDLPPVDDAEVLELVKKLIEEDLPTLRPVKLENAVEVSFDAALQKRVGRCELATKHGKEPAEYTINWQNRKTGIWQVQVPRLLPAVDSPAVIDILKGLVALDPRDPAAILNPVQTAYDPARQKRSGKAMVATRNNLAQIAYTIEWDNRDTGMYRVKIQP